MNNLSNERLEYVIGRLEHVADNVKFGNVSAAQELLQAADGLRELLALREAGKEPVAFTEKHEISNMQATGLYLRAWPADRKRNAIEGYTVGLYAAPQLPGGWVMVPKVPSKAHLNSIAMRYRHDFYLLNDAQKDSALATARQMYEECSGQGFFTIAAAPKPE
ncbi:hypothetical protein [Cedecea sp. P7760]|uniref:hypothetical protein n=1 Tax=Cedecea sp. P7760 TaxID=2726983 RepID=UPI0015A10704|nr:hypothetical protein [Cedecea sp. P7760]NWC63692.1 hypothetical protein [Cedecea sp. P7760]